MSLTAQVKSELVRVPVGNTETRRAEVAALLRFAGTLQVLSGRLVIEAEVDSGEIADRLAQGWGVCVRPGAHCAPLMHTALGTQQQGVVRFSFGAMNSQRDCDDALSALRDIACP